MKKLALYSLPLALLSCGGNNGETGSNPEVNNGEQSSVVETTHPEITSENHEGHDHNEASGEITTIEFFDVKHDFGNVFYPSDNPFTFKFKNTGSIPLVIKEATASCGCTIPNKPEEPIAPGQVGEIDVIFRPKEGQVGQTVTKKITVVANTAPAETYLEISAKVMESM